MAETPDPNKPKTLDDFKGTKREQTAAKSAFIAKYGYGDFEKLVQDSSIHVKK
ncbi:MAG: hypothetical protein WA485_08990 [Candidatus Sulfotelmatobacter sp.]